VSFRSCIAVTAEGSTFVHPRENQLFSSLTFCQRDSLSSFVPEPVTAEIG